MPEGSPLRVLIVDDDPLTLRLLSVYLEGGGHQVLTAGNGTEAMQILLSKGPHMIITDWIMPEMDGLELCRRIRGHEGIAIAYIIIVTAHTDEDRIVEAFDAGADDYLSKPFNRRELLARVRAGSRIVQLQLDLDRRNLEVHRFNAEMALAHSKLRDANDKLRHIATTDELTDLTNRRAAMERLQEYWVSADRHNDSLACVMLDIDRFKNVNDSFGHAIGDLVLKETAGVLRREARTEEQVCRIGGEEFLVLCPRTSETSAAVVAERLRLGIESHTINADDQSLGVTVSLGVAQRTPEMRSPDDLLAAADRALYAAKKSGRNRVCLAGDCQEQVTSDPAFGESFDVRRAHSADAAAQDQPAKVLIVADDVRLRRACVELLEGGGYLISEAPSFYDAVGKDEQPLPGVVIMEFGPTVAAACENVRTVKGHPRTLQSTVLLITSQNDAADISSAYAAGADQCISRAELSRDLAGHVRNAVHSRSQRVELAHGRETTASIAGQ